MQANHVTKYWAYIQVLRRLYPTWQVSQRGHVLAAAGEGKGGGKGLLPSAYKQAGVLMSNAKRNMD